MVRKFVEKSASRFTGRDAVIFALRGVYIYEKTAMVANIAKKAPITRVIVSDSLQIAVQGNGDEKYHRA